jgi:hypothetical protein
LTASGVVGFAPLIAALIGLSIVRKGTLSTLLIGLWVGYLSFCLMFTYHIRFGPHYHSQLIIIVALCLGPLILLISNRFRQLSIEWLRWLPIAAGLILIMAVNLNEIRSRLKVTPTLESRELSQKIGELVGHSTETVYIAYNYGTPLEYYGEISGAFWPNPISDKDQTLGITHERSVEERLDALDFNPEFYVVTNFRLFNADHSDLKDYFEKYCSPFAINDEYLIYNNCIE